MKNFSAKNAEFETVTINNEAAITSADIGTAPNKIPLNKDLGSLAYQDAVNLDDVSADMIELRAIAAEISDSAVDVFVYDTSRDSDGGAWRKRTQHTSWYNEELNTATRGARREFPAVAVIVVESETLTIYDGDDPDLSMWMVFEATYIAMVTTNILTSDDTHPLSSVFALQGILCIGISPLNGFQYINFVDDSAGVYRTSISGVYNGNILERNDGKGYTANSGSFLVDDTVNDVAMTVLPNAPIDENTGLPVPTIAVATDGGVSVIKDDGTVVDITVNDTSYTYSRSVTWSSVNDLIVVLGNESGTHDYIYTFDKFNSSDNQITIDSKDGTTQNARSFFRRVYNSMFDGFTVQGSSTDRKFWLESTEQNKFAVRSVSGLTIIDENATNSSKSLYNYITSKYNTGWMPGDIKLAALSDSVVENVGVNSDNLLTGDNSTFDVGVGDWSPIDLTSHSNDLFPGTNSNSLKIDVDTDQLGWSSNTVSTVVGQAYMIALDYAFSIGCTKITVVDSTATVINRDFFPAGGDGATSIHFIAESTQTEIRLVTYSGEAFFDNISVRATTELITNGDFSNGTTGWGETSAPTLTVIDDGVNLKVLSGDNQAGFHQNINANNINQKYILSFEASDFTGDNAANLIVGSGDFWSTEGSLGSTELINTKEDGSYSVSFNGRTNGMSILFRIYDTTGACSVDTHMNIKNISVRPAEEDRSVNGNGLQIVGEINKTPVARGADLVAYSGFSADNYLVQPYNEDLLNIDQHSLIGWCKVSSTNTEQTFFSFMDGDLEYNLNSTWTLCGCSSDGLLFVQAIKNGENNFIKGGTVESTGSWHHFCFIVGGSDLIIYKDGIEVTRAPRTTGGSLYLSDSQLRVGARITASSNNVPADSTSLALVRLSKTAPTAEQIAKIYRDEKPLFQQGAQATLYGTSDAVTALAYDDSEQLLHVGTASGRSDFRGLARVNNTTTAISNSISAAEGTIIQN
jgi:hypothetical protein